MNRKCLSPSNRARSFNINESYLAIFRTTNIRQRHCVELGKYFAETHITVRNPYGDRWF